ncbi:hypothetical protein FDENT_12891 [Fusarium denticulatum]|uniref:Uncharacterized protein n=1 Tax=Fusarium denticulatum TaxID=48507 RepID=A0A8H5WIV1_9HYPO|nr:hypothetical protein FDENT_12891 [Fusarium denticulatum]
MGRLRLVVVVLDLRTDFDAILKAHGKQYVINSTKYTPENARQYKEHVIAFEAYVGGIRDAFEKDQTLGGKWVKDKIDAITVRAPGFIPDDVTTEASGVKMAIRVVTGYLCFHDLLAALEAVKFVYYPYV